MRHGCREDWVCAKCLDWFVTQDGAGEHARVCGGEIRNTVTLTVEGLACQVTVVGGRVRVHFDSHDLDESLCDEVGTPNLDISVNESDVMNTQDMDWGRGVTP